MYFTSIKIEFSFVFRDTKPKGREAQILKTKVKN